MAEDLVLAIDQGTGSTKTAAPAIAPDDLGEIDLVLLTHDHHEDNLDAAGRALLPRAKTVVTTASGAWNPSCSHSSNPSVRVPARNSGCQLWLA